MTQQIATIDATQPKGFVPLADFASLIEDDAPDFVERLKATASGAIMYGNEALPQGTIVRAVGGKRERIFWADDAAKREGLYKPEEMTRPLCKSDDGVTGRGLAVERSEASGVCSGCPLAEWGDDDSPPRCSNIRVLLVQLTDGREAEIHFKGSTFKQFGAVAQHAMNNPENAHFAVSAVRKTSRRGDPYGILSVQPIDFNPMGRVVVESTAREVRNTPHPQSTHIHASGGTIPVEMSQGYPAPQDPPDWYESDYDNI